MSSLLPRLSWVRHPWRRSGRRSPWARPSSPPRWTPAKGSAAWALSSHGVAETLFTVDREGAIAPLLAEEAWREGPRRFRVRIKDGIRFSDGTPLTADDVARALNRNSEINPAAQASAGRLAASAVNGRNLVIATERPVAAIQPLLAEWPMALYRQDGDLTLFTGPYRVTAFRPDAEIALEPNLYYPGAERRPDVRLRRFADAQALALAFEGGAIDLAFNLPTESLPRLKRLPDRVVKSFQVSYQYMLWLNTERAPLDDARVRQAIDAAIDRDQLVRGINGGAPATGAFVRFYPFAYPTARPYDPVLAHRLLDEAGLTKGQDGLRHRGEKPLTLRLHAYPRRPDLVTLQPILKSLLAAVGIQTKTLLSDGVSALAKSSDFDLLLWAQHTAPAGEPGFFLNAFFRSGAGNNHSRFRSPELDALLDRLAATEDPAQQADIARAAQELIFAAAPVAFLLTPEWHVGLSRRLQHYEPWGSDYYILRADLTVGG
ncbi:MAG: peptide-binding protein [Alphaproteobacteria bacterium]|nr:peptide-binding protein [Alphaproteobacteria bacterium]